MSVVGQKRKSSPALLHVRCCSESGRCCIKWKTSAKGRVEMWRGGDRLNISVCRLFRLAVP
jgi:hypothetical protein